MEHPITAAGFPAAFFRLFWVLFQAIWSANRFCLQAVFVAPFTHSVKNRDQGFASLGQAVFRLRGNLWISLPVYQPV